MSFSLQKINEGRPKPGQSPVVPGAGQYPTLLVGYAARPLWQVVGVDVAAGVPAGTVLKSPTTISMVGVVVNTSTKVIDVTGSGITFDAYDFTGYHFNLHSANTTISNSLVAIGTDSCLNGFADASNLHLDHCTLDGLSSTTVGASLITWGGNGMTIEWCWLKNASGDSVQFHVGSGDLIMHHNLFDQAGMGINVVPEPAHGDFLQMFNTTNATAVCTFNTTRQAGPGFTQGFMVEECKSGAIENNTFVNLGGNPTQIFFTGVFRPSIIPGPVPVRNNYFAGGALAHPESGNGGQPDDGDTKTSYLGNVDMVTGLASTNDTSVPISLFPDATNTGFRNAPGYSGTLTPGPATIVANTTYQFMEWTTGVGIGEVGTSGGAAVNNVSFYGCRFRRTGILNVGIIGDNISFDYCSFEPLAVSAPPVSNAQGYQYGIAGNGGFFTAVQKLTVTHCDIWGFANAIDTRGSTQAKPHRFEHNWIHDPRDPINPAIPGSVDDDHTDGIGALGVDDFSEYVVINHNTIEADANTNAIGYQFSSTGFNHFTITDNLISGWNNAINFGGVPGDSANSTASFITFTGNTFSTKITITNGINHQEWYLTTGTVWSGNKWKVPLGAAWGTPANDGMFWIPSTVSRGPVTDFPYVSDHDYLSPYVPPVGGTTDNFNRANGSLGGNWGTDRGALSIVSNQVKGTSGQNCVTWRTSGTFAANQYSEIVWQGSVSSGGGPVVRHNGANPGSYYGAFFDGLRMYLQKVVAGVYTDLNVGGTLFDPINGDVLRLEVTGSLLIVKRNGIELYRIADTSFATGRPGFEIFNNVIAINDWTGGDAVAGPAVATDNFNRADGGLGANWGVDTTAINVVSNQAKASSGVNCRAFRSAETFAANHYSQVVWQGGANNGGGPFVRHNGASPGAYYLAFCNAATDTIMISRSDSGSYATLVSLGSTSIVNGDVIRLEAIGTTLNLYLNGVLKLTTTHTDFVTGRPGFEIFNTSVALDNWGGGDL